MEQLTQTHPAQVYWRSYELRPKNSPPLPAAYLARIEAGRPQLYATARQNYGLEMNPGPFGIDTRPALIGTKVAEAQGVGPAYHERVMRAYWQEAIDISDRSQLAELAAAAGIDRSLFLAALDDEKYAEEVQTDIDQAAAFGLQGVPALVFDNRYLVSGAQPLNVLQQVMTKIAEEG